MAKAPAVEGRCGIPHPRIASDPALLALNDRLAASGVGQEIARAYRKLPEDERTKFEEAAGSEFADALPLYLALSPDERSRALVVCRTIRPLTVALKVCRRRLEDH